MQQHLQQLQSRVDYMSTDACHQAAHVLFPAFAQSVLVYKLYIRKQLTASTTTIALR